MVGIGAVHHHHSFDLTRQRRLFTEMAHTEKVALALLTHVGHQQETQRALRQFGAILPNARHGEQGGQTGAVVGNSGAAESAVAIDRDIVLIARGDHGIEVRA